MTNVTDYAPIKYGCNGASVDFVFPWKIFENEDVIVQIQDSTGNISTLNYGADYSVQFEAVGGNVKLKSVFETGNSVIISRNVSDYQEKSFSTSPGFQASEIEKSLDRVSCNLQEMDYNIENFKETYSAQVGAQIEDLENVIEENKQEVLVIQERFEDSTNAKIEQFKTETNTAIKDFEDGIDAKIATVADAADKINTLDESIQICKESAEIASEKAEIAANKADEILNVKDELEAEIGTKANKVDVLTKSQITNCILEIPQRIKLELNDGTLTLKAGSVVIVPNGFEADGTTPKFDYVTVKNDISATNPQTDVYMLWVNSDGTAFGSRRLATQQASGTTTPTSGTWTYYNTTLNKVQRVDNGVLGTAEYSLPIAIYTADGAIKTIDQVFNGIGYMGSTVWVDKDVKGLIPNGRNEDGTLNNIDYATERISLLTMGSNNLTRYLYIPESGVLSNIYSTRYFTGNFSQAPKTVPTTSACYFFAVDLNKRFITTGSTTANWVETTNVLDIGSVVEVSGVVNALHHKTPFRAVDFSQIDGNWVSHTSTLANKVSLTGSSNLEYDVSSIIPNDGHNYEVMLQTRIDTGTTSGNYVALYIKGSIIENWATVAQTFTRTNSSMTAGGTIILPIGLDRKIYVSRQDSWVGTFVMNLNGYRRLGTNA